MGFYEQMGETVLDVVRKHKSDLTKAVNECFDRVRKFDGYDEYVSTLVRQALRERIHRARHGQNVSQRRENGHYGNGAKVVTAGSNAVSEGARKKSLYDYFVSGRILGDMTGADLASMAVMEGELASGHLFNHALFTELGKIVPKDKMVREAVKEGRLKAIFTKLQKRGGLGKAA
jgi:hypothetical protein